MSVDSGADNLQLAVRHALLTTRATAVCPFHPDVTIRVGDDAAETHAFYRARNLVKSDGTGWDHAVLVEEIARAAPPFRTLHKRYPVETLEDALAEGMSTGHPRMPEFRLDPDQVGDFISFLKSLE